MRGLGEQRTFRCSAGRLALFRVLRRQSEIALSENDAIPHWSHLCDYVAVEQWSRNIVRDHYVCLVQLHEQHLRFAKTLDANSAFRQVRDRSFSNPFRSCECSG
jgi:hypothetical protein